MPLIPALRMQRQVDLCEFKNRLTYKVNSRKARTVSTEKPCLEKQKKREDGREGRRKKERKEEPMGYSV